MTGYQSKRAAAQDKLAQPEPDATMQSLKDLLRSVCDEVGKTAFAQPAQEPVAWNPKDHYNDGWKDGFITATAHPAQEPVAMRMPKVGDRVVCIEDESLATVQSLTAGGSPDIKFDDGSHGTYLLREFAELFRYASTQQRPWEPMETAPKDGTNILLMYMHIDTQVVHNGFWIGVSDTDDESDIGWWSYDHSELSRIKLDDWMTPTHWLPLPKLKERNT